VLNKIKNDARNFEYRGFWDVDIDPNDDEKRIINELVKKGYFRRPQREVGMDFRGLGGPGPEIQVWYPLTNKGRRYFGVTDSRLMDPEEQAPAPRRRRVAASAQRARERANKPPRRVDETPRPLVVKPDDIDSNFGAEPDLGGSVPDVRSERNVRNRFRERGLPDTAYWRDDLYQGDDKAELERRFGRYYDDSNRRNARGDFVNNRIREGGGQPARRRQPPAAPREPDPSIQRILDEEAEVAARVGDPADLAEQAIEAARQQADDAENAVRAPIPTSKAERKRQIAVLRQRASEALRNLDQMERNGARDALVREEQRRLDAIQNRIMVLQGTRTRGNSRPLRPAPVRGDSDNAAESERLRRARADAARRPGRVLNSIVADQRFLSGYIATVTVWLSSMTLKIFLIHLQGKCKLLKPLDKILQS